MLLRASSDATRRSNHEPHAAHTKPKIGSAESSNQNGGYHGALLAANTAYRRAHGIPIPREKGRVANKLQKSRFGSSSEGSHLAQRHRRHQLRKSTSSEAALTAHQRVLRRYGVRNGDENSEDGYRAGCEVQPEPSIARAQDFLEADAQLGIQSTPEEAVASAPSSYRKLPKSASTTAPKSNGTTMQTQKLNAQKAEDDDAQFAENLLASIRSVRRPMGSEISNTLSVPDTGTSLAVNEEQNRNFNRDKILRNFQQMKLRERPSFSSFVARKRQDHAPSYSSNNDSGVNITFHKEDVLNQGHASQAMSAVGTESKAKNDSRSLKSRFKKIFRKSSQTEDGLPIQHLEATKLHFGSDIASISSSKRRSDSLVDSEEKKLLSESPEVSFSMDMPERERYARSRASSGTHSEGGNSNTKSRVTSWSNSTVANTLSSKPLSIINEYVSRAHSLNLSSRVVSGGSGQAQPFSQPAVAYGHPTEYKGIDARQLCSALMRNEAEKDLPRPNNLKQNHSPNNAMLKSIHHTLPSQSRNTSFGSIATRLRMQRSNISKPGPEVLSSLQNENITKPCERDTDSVPMLLAQKSPTQIKGDSTPKKERLLVPERRYERVNKVVVPSTAEIARRVDRGQNRWRMTLEEAKFAESAPVTEYERLLDNARRAEYNGLELTKAIYEDHNPSVICLTNPAKNFQDKPYKESSPNLRSWLEDFRSQEEYDDRGRLTNTIEDVNEIIAHGISRNVPMDFSTQCNASWQEKQPAQVWDDVAKSQKHTDRDVNKALNDPSSHRGHRRELTQISDTENAEVDNSVTIKAYKKEAKSRPKLESRQTSRMNERFPIIETGRDLYRQAKSSTETLPNIIKKDTDGVDKENQATEMPRESRLIHNKFQSLQAMKATSINQTDKNRNGRTPDKLDIGDIRSRKDYHLRPSPLRQHLSTRTNKARSIVDLRSQSYDTAGMTLSTSPSPLSSHQFKQIRRKPTAIAELYAAAAVNQALDEPNSHINTYSYARSSPAADSRGPQTPSPSRSHSRSRLGGSVTPTSGQRMADVFINSRRSEQYIHHQHRQHHQPPWLKEAGGSPVFL